MRAKYIVFDIKATVNLIKVWNTRLKCVAMNIFSISYDSLLDIGR